MFTLIAVATAVAAFEFAALKFGTDSRLDVRDVSARQGASARWL